MNLDMFTKITNLKRSLDYHLQRHNVLASNLANAETPGYVPKDIVFAKELEKASAASATNAGHLGPQAGSAAENELVEVEQPNPGGDQNGVRLERAMAQISANRLRFNAAVNLTQRQLAMLRYAATDGSS